MEIDYIEIGKRIAKRRKEMDIKQNTLAERINISNNYLSSIECGKEKPSLEVLIGICNSLQITPDYLFMGNMHSNNVPMCIMDGLRLCSEDDVELVLNIVRICVDRNRKNWNSDNFV